MRVTSIYLVISASISAALIFWKLYRSINYSTCQAIQTWLRKTFLYTLIFRRRRSTDSVNVFSMLYIGLYFGANVTVCALGVVDRTGLAHRSGKLFLINMIPLYLGGRLSFFTDRLMQVQPWHQSLAHRWIGRVCVIQGLLHGILNLFPSSATAVQIMVSFKHIIFCNTRLMF
jgi:hypothetical protein